MSLTPRKICPVCKKTGLKYLRPHLRHVHELTGEEREQMLEKAVYNIPAVSAETISSAANTDSAKNESSSECDKDAYVREWLEKQEKVYVQEVEKCQRKRKRTMNEHEYAMKEVNNALRWFSKSVHCCDIPYTRCGQCKEFKRHVNFMLREVTH